MVVGKVGDFVVYHIGLAYASVCTTLPREAVEERMNREYESLEGPWKIAEEKFATGETNPCSCEANPLSQHYLLCSSRG